MIFHYFFFNNGFKFQDYVCNGCHDLRMLNVNIRDIAIITVKNVDYCCIIHNISINIIFLLSIYKMVDIMGIYKYLNISIGTVMKNQEMLKFVPYHLRTKKMRKHAVKNLPYPLRYIPDQYKTQ